MFSCVVSAQPVTTIYLPYGVLAQPTKKGIEGAFPDILREAARRIGQPVKLKALVWKRSQELAKREVGAAAAPLTRIPPREPHYVWIEAITPLNLTFMVRRDSELNPASIEELSGLKVAIQRGGVADAMTNNNQYPGMQIVLNSDNHSNIRMVQHGRVDGWLIWDLVGIQNLKNKGLEKQFKTTFRYTVGPLYLATNVSVSQQSLSQWRKALQQMKQDGSIQRILRQHYGVIATRQ